MKELQNGYINSALNSILFSVNVTGEHVNRKQTIPNRMIILVSCFFALVVVLTGTASATDYYVATDGNNANVGTLPDPWQTITYAATQAQAGDTVYIKGGNYGHEHVVISNSGTSGNPIVFEGYGGVPVIDGQDRTGKGIHINSKKYVEIKNIEITRYEYGVLVANSYYITLDSIIVTNIGGVTNYYSGWGIKLFNSDYNTVKNSSVTDARAENFVIHVSNNNLIEDCASYGIRTDNAVDYYIVIINSDDNIIRNCITENKHRDSTVQPGHGIGIKDTYYNGYKSSHSQNNKIINSETHGHGEHFFVAHFAHDNEFINVTAYDDDLNPYFDTQAFRIRDGAYNNRFTNSRAIETRYGAFFDDTTEAAAEGTQITRNNIFTNCIFDVTNQGVYFSRTEDNIFTNCVFTGSSSLFGGRYQSGNKLKNSIVFGIPNLGISGINMVYSNFWNNGFSMPAGTGNTENDPGFVDAPTEVNTILTIDETPTEVIIDNGDPGTSFTGRWDVSGGENPYGTDSLYGRNGATYTWHADLPQTGVYEVHMWWTEYTSRSTNAPVTIEYYSGSEVVDVNQQQNGGEWNHLGTYSFDKSTVATVTITTEGSVPSYSADAVKFVYVPDANIAEEVTETLTIDETPTEVIIDNGDSGTSFTGRWDVSGGKNPYGTDSLYSRNGATYTWHADLPQTGVYEVHMWWTEFSSRSTNAPVTIEYYSGSEVVYVNQQQNGGVWNHLGTYSFDESTGATVAITAEGSVPSYSADAVKFVYVPDANN